MMRWGFVFAGWYLWLPVTFFCGRVFCRYLCPLGLSQSLVHFLCHPHTHVRRVCTELPRTHSQRVVNGIFLAAYFLAPFGALLNPWGVFGRVLVLFVPGVVLYAAILLSAVFGRGRLWCNWICPFGTIFDLVAKLGWHRDRISPRCHACGRCFR